MLKHVAIQLPTADLKKSKAFYSALGFKVNDDFGPYADKMIHVELTEGASALFLTREFFSGFTRNSVADAQAATEVINALGVESREEVDALLQKAAAAGGELIGEAREMDNAVYFGNFEDPDGHQWEVNFMLGMPNGSGEK